MSSMGVDVGVMWRLSEDLNAARRFAVRVHQQHQHHHHHHHRPPMPVIYSGNLLQIIFSWKIMRIKNFN